MRRRKLQMKKFERLDLEIDDIEFGQVKLEDKKGMKVNRIYRADMLLLIMHTLKRNEKEMNYLNLIELLLNEQKLSVSSFGCY